MFAAVLRPLKYFRNPKPPGHCLTYETHDVVVGMPSFQGVNIYDLPPVPLKPSRKVAGKLQTVPIEDTIRKPHERYVVMRNPEMPKGAIRFQNPFTGHVLRRSRARRGPVTVRGNDHRDLIPSLGMSCHGRPDPDRFVVRMTRQDQHPSTRTGVQIRNMPSQKAVRVPVRTDPLQNTIFPIQEAYPLPVRICTPGRPSAAYPLDVSARDYDTQEKSRNASQPFPEVTLPPFRRPLSRPNGRCTVMTTVINAARSGGMSPVPIRPPIL